VNSAFVGSIGSTYQWAGTNGDGIIMQAGSLVIEPIELDVTFMNKKGNEMKENRTHITIDPDAWIELEASTEGVTLTCHDERVTSHVKLTWKNAAELTKFIRKANFERMGDTQDLQPVSFGQMRRMKAQKLMIEQLKNAKKKEEK